MSPDDPPDHVRLNRATWDGWAAGYVEPGRRAWAVNDPAWGIWQVREAELRVLPDVAGRDTLELGCGTGYVSSWLARRGARAVGLDNSRRQLAAARSFQREFGVEFPLIHANAEEVPLADASFDLAVSEYGASIWCDPHRWIPEAARLLRPDGRLVFLTNGTLLMLCVHETWEVPASDRMLRPYFGMHRFESPGDPSVEFHLGYGDCIRLLRRCGFEVEDLIEVRPPEGATSRYPFVTLDWSRRWPCEEIWIARRRG
jgi:SAM-dependent methyltransferase